MRLYKIYSLYAIAALAAMTSCEKESNFLFNTGEGQLNCAALSVDYINSNSQVRAGGSVNIDDFNINIVKEEGNSKAIVQSYKYGEMPQVITLPKGDYSIEADYGNNPISAWEEPYYLGNTSFTIKEGEITDDVDPVECELSNIRITVNINDLDLGLVGDDVQVVVKAGSQGSLTYTNATNDKAGYFRYVDNSETITATLTGTIDGIKIGEGEVDAIVRCYDNAKAGNSYRINFNINKPNNMEPGDITISDGGLEVDATIAIRDMNHKIDPNEPEEELLVDDMRPKEEKKDEPTVTPDDPGQDTPNTGDDPNEGTQPTPGASGPQVILLSDGLVLNQCCVLSECAFDVTSETGITAFDIDIESPNLTDEELATINLRSHIDLVNTGDMAEGLSGLGFPVNVGGQKSCHFDITQFLPLLKVFGEAEHKFHLTITDAEGTFTGFIGIKIVL